MQAALAEAEHGGPEAISIKALAKSSGSRSRRLTGILPTARRCCRRSTAEAFRQFNTIMREAIDKPSKRSKLSRLAQAALDFGLRRNGIYRLMFASRTMACAAMTASCTSPRTRHSCCLSESFEAPKVGLLRERHALQIWAALHGVVMLAEQGLLTGKRRR